MGEGEEYDIYPFNTDRIKVRDTEDEGTGESKERISGILESTCRGLKASHLTLDLYRSKAATAGREGGEVGDEAKLIIVSVRTGRTSWEDDVESKEAHSEEQDERRRGEGCTRRRWRRWVTRGGKLRPFGSSSPAASEGGVRHRALIESRDSSSDGDAEGRRCGGGGDASTTTRSRDITSTPAAADFTDPLGPLASDVAALKHAEKTPGNIGPHFALVGHRSTRDSRAA